MAITFLVCLFVAAASAAPYINNPVIPDWQQQLVDNLEFNKLQEVYRQKRSNYGNLYMTPCAAAAASAPLHAYSPVAANSYAGQHMAAYGNPAAGVSPVAAYTHAAYNMVPTQKVNPSSSPYGYGRPYYRSAEQFEDDQEVMGFSDSDQAMLDHMPTARYAVNAPSSGPMVGVFPNANTGGCNVPLLVSCSPSIVHGRLIKTQPYYDYSSSPSAASQSNVYRVVDDHSLEGLDGHHEKTGSSSEHNISHHDTKPNSDKHQ